MELTGNIAIAHQLMDGRMDGWRVVASQPDECPHADMEHKVLTVPSLPLFSRKADQYTKDVIRGLTTHETGHALYTGKMKPSWSQLMRNVVNMLEDQRIERKLSGKSEVASHDLYACNDHFIGRYRDAFTGEGGDSAGNALTILHLENAQTHVRHEWPMDAETKAVYELVAPLFRRWENCDTFEDVVALSKKICDMIEAMEAKGEGEDKESGEKRDGSKGGSKGGSKSDENSGSDESENGRENGSSEKGKPENGSGRDGKSDGSDGSKGEGGGSESNESGKPESKKKPESKNEKSGGSEGGKNGKARAKGGSSDGRSSASDCGYEEFRERSAREMLKEAAPAETSGWIVRDDDTTVWKVPEPNMGVFDKVHREIAGKTSILAGHLASCLKAESRCRYHGGMDSGRLDHNAFPALIVSHDSNIFRQKQRGISLDVAVTVLVDLSGSMCNDCRDENARRVTIAMSEALNALRIKFEVLGHTTDGLIAKSDPNLPQRLEYLKMYQFKSFDENYAAVKGRLSAINSYANNVDGEALELAAARNFNQRARRHVVLVLSDGAPLCELGTTEAHKALREHLKQVVKEIRQCGVECYSIGIDTKSAEQYYGEDYSICIDNAELNSAFANALARIIIKGRMK